MERMDPDLETQGYHGQVVSSAALLNSYGSTNPSWEGNHSTLGERNEKTDRQENGVGSRLPRDMGSTGESSLTSPAGSRPGSSHGSYSDKAAGQRADGRGLRYFHSRRVPKGNVEKPWLQKHEPKEKWITIIPVMGIVTGLLIAGFLIWDGLHSVVHHKYCPLINDDFAGGLNTNMWTKEVTVGGFGNGEFDETTGTDENVFVQNGNLIIKATLQDEDKITNNYVMNLLKDGTCTSNTWSDCVAATNTSAGNSSIVPPTKSGRINSKKGARLKYGRVEVTAKLPQGDWLWPAIWMMPVQNTYGPWPASGEIDIMESRGNNWTYGQGGNDIVSSALHWGPDPDNDAWWRTNNKFKALRTTYADSFNTYGLEWSEKYLFTFVNTRLLQVLYTDFNKPMWRRGGFPGQSSNGTKFVDKWTGTGHDNAPFDQEFYLIINLAVGGTNGWFEDGKSGKPWVDASENAPKDFWQARSQWYPTWKQPQLEISRVVMMRQCNNGGGGL